MQADEATSSANQSQPAAEPENSGVVEHVWPAAFTDLALAYSNRYPSPLSKHIISQDVIERRFDSDDNTLHTRKLIHKSGKLPRWAPKGIINRAETWVLEDTALDLSKGTLVSTTRNLDHRNVLDITESYSLSRLDSSRTLASTHATVLSSFGSSDSFFTLYLRQRVQSYGVSSFKRNVERSRASLQLILTLLTHPESTYRKNILHPDMHPPLPHDLMQDQFVRQGIVHWQSVGEGFSGHGIDPGHNDISGVDTNSPSEVRSNEERFTVRRRPEYLEPTNWLWWRARWRPDLPLELLDRSTSFGQRQSDTETLRQTLVERWKRLRAYLFGENGVKSIHSTQGSKDGKDVPSL